MQQHPWVSVFGAIGADRSSWSAVAGSNMALHIQYAHVIEDEIAFADALATSGLKDARDDPG